MSSFMWSAGTDTHLVLDPEGHTGRIMKMQFTPDEKFLLSCAEDKTIKVWDVEHGVCVKTIRGYIGEGFVGILNRIAVSPDGRYVASGGYFEQGAFGTIRVHDLSTGEVIYYLDGHMTQGVVALQFSPDGKYLASGGSDNMIRIWDCKKKFALAYELQLHQHHVYGLAFSPDGKRLASAAFDKSIALWDMRKGTLITHKGSAHDREILNIAYSPDGKHLLTAGFDNKVILWNAKTINKVRVLSDEGQTTNIAFSPDGIYALYGGNHPVKTDDGQAFPVFFYNLKKNMVERRFMQHDTTVTSITFSKSGKYVASTGGNSQEIFIYNPQTLEVKSVLKSKGTAFFATGYGTDGKTLYFGNTFTMERPIEQSFSLLDFTIKSAGDTNYVRSYDTVNDMTFEFPGWNSVIIGGKKVTVPSMYDTIFCSTFTPDGAQAVIGAQFTLSRIDVAGPEVSGFFKGHTGTVWSVSVSEDGTAMLSAGHDQTLRLWDMNDFTGKKELAGYDDPQFSAEWKNFIKTYLPHLDMTTKEGVTEFYTYLKNNYPDYYEYFAKSFPENRPVISIFLTDAGEYLVWTPDNYYMGNKKLFKYVGWHINRGEDKQALFYPFEQFDLKFNRPDIILDRLGFVDKQVVAAYHAMYLKRLKKMGFEESDLSGEYHLPEVAFSTNVKNNITGKENVILKIDARDTKYALDRVNISINEVPLYGRGGISLKDKKRSTYKQSLTIPLAHGKNKIQVSVLNEKGVESFKETMTIHCTKSAGKPDLYIATIGVSEYQDTRYNLQYAHKDAENLIEVYKANPVYNKVHVHRVNNRDAVSENISGIKEFFNKSTIDDQVVLFIAGHGMLDNSNEYYFCTHDIDFDKPQENGYRFDDLDNLLDGIPSIHKLFLMDTCFSGEQEDDAPPPAFTDEELGGTVTSRAIKQIRGLKKGPVHQDQLMLLKKDIFTNLKNGTGAIVISSSSAEEVSYEGVSDKGVMVENGVFTYTIISGLSDYRCDVNADKKIQVSELMNWIYREVPRITRGRQNPMMRREKVEFDFNVY